MFDVDRILAIPDQSIDYLQMGISGGERAALAARGFVRKDGIKAKDYMIRTIQKTEKNKAKAEKAVIKGDKKLPVKLSKPAKSLNQKSDQAYRLHEQTKAKVEKLKDKLSDLYDEGSKLQDRLDEAKSKVESGRTKKASSTQKNIGKFAASLQSELANGGQPVPVMRQKGNKKQIAELDDKINENFNQRIALQSQVKRLQSRASKLLDASQDYADKASQSSSAIAPDTAKKLAITDKKGFQSEGSAAKKIKTAIASTSATPKSRKVVKGESPDTRNAGYINYGGGKAQKGKIRLVDYRNKDVNAYVAKLNENGDRRFIKDHGKTDPNSYKGKENVKEWNIRKLEDGVYEANSRQGIGTRGVEKSYFSVKKGKIDNYFDNYQQAKEVLTPKEKRINKTSLSGSSEKQISYAESVRDKAIAKLQSKGLSPSDIQKAISDPQTQTARWWLDNKDNAADKIYNAMLKQKVKRL